VKSKESGISNFFLKENKAPMADVLCRFAIKARADNFLATKRKLDISWNDVKYSEEVQVIRDVNYSSSNFLYEIKIDHVNTCKLDEQDIT
jgi:hypothetical protein